MGHLKSVKKSYLVTKAKQKINMLQEKEARLIVAKKSMGKIKEKLDRIKEKKKIVSLGDRLDKT